MANDARKWIPLALIAGAVAVGAYALRDLPPTVTIDLRGLLPFALERTGDTAPRWVAIVGIPAIATLVWALLNAGRHPGALRLARVLFPDAPETLTDPASIDRFRGTYDTIVLWIVVLVLGVHAGMIAAALGHVSLAPRIVAVAMGISLVAAGNVLPRLRPNLVAGVRTRRMLNDPALWRATHRVLGFAFVIAGIVTTIVGLAAPAYGLPTAVLTLITACIVATLSGLRAGRAGAVVAIAIALALGVQSAATKAPSPGAVVRLPALAGVAADPTGAHGSTYSSSSSGGRTTPSAP